MKKNNKFLFVIVSIFVLVASITTFVSFSSNVDVQEVVVKSITPVYDENSTVVVDNNNVVFNDKNQVVEYKVVIENTQNYDVKINNITLSTPTEEFLTYEVQDIEENDILTANSTKELTICLETTGIKGWGRNFQDELTVNISFDRITKNEEVEPPQKEENKDEVEPPKEDIKQPEKPVASTEELISKTEKIEIIKVTKDTIEFKETPKLENGDKIAVWIYSEPIFLGYFEVVEKNGIKQIVGLEEALKEADIESGEHHIVLATEENETIGYVEVYVDEKQQVSEDKLTTEEDSKIENPYTNTGLIILYTTVAGVAVIGIIVLRNKKVNKYFILVIAITSTLSFVKAEETIELSITQDVSFKSQNVMKPSGFEYDFGGEEPLSQPQNYWKYIYQIKNFYIQNEITEIDEYAYQFDVTEEQNGRVIAYLVERNDGLVCNNLEREEDLCYDLYLQADGVIYPNKDASYYFAGMDFLDSINNLEGFDTSEVTDMSAMFGATGYYSENFALNLGDKFDTINVTDMSSMFINTGSESPKFTLFLGKKFDTSNVTDMSHMFAGTGYNSEIFTLDVSNFDTSSVINMSSMFANTGVNNPEFTLDVSNFDTSNVTDMSNMFFNTGYNSTNFTLDLSNFDTSNVTNMSYMFENTGRNSENFTLDVSNFDTSNVTDMSYMFYGTGYNSENFTLDVSNFDTRNLTDMSSMFYGTGYNSTKLNTSITIKNSKVNYYSQMFQSTALKQGTQIKVNYTEETNYLAAKMVATRTEGTNVKIGNCIDCDDNYIPIGTEININDEKFNVISQTDATVTMLAQYNLGTDYKQTTERSGLKFSDSKGWDYSPGPKEIDIQTWSTNPKTYVNAYVDYLKPELGDDFVTGDLITLKELDALACRVPSNYGFTLSVSGRTCTNSPYKSWLINNQNWWTRSSSSEYDDEVWGVLYNGTLSDYYISSFIGVRPVITISKEALENYLKTS